MGYILTGKVELTIGNDKKILFSGEGYYVPSYVQHGFYMFTDKPVVNGSIYYHLQRLICLNVMSNIMQKSARFVIFDRRYKDFILKININYIFLVSTFIGVLSIILSIPTALNKIKPNKIYGFRTPKTLSNEVIWYKINKFSSIVFIYCGLITIFISLILFFLNYNFSYFIGFAVFIIVLFTPMITGLIISVNYLKKL